MATRKVARKGGKKTRRAMKGGQCMKGGQNKMMGGQNKMMGGQNKMMGGKYHMMGGQNKMMGGQNKMMGGKRSRKGTPWTAFVKKIYAELKKKNPDAKLGDAMKAASKRKSEM